jgi:hypothetical protein
VTDDDGGDAGVDGDDADDDGNDRRVAPIEFVDVLPYGLGIHNAGDKLSTILPRYHCVPGEASKLYQTTTDLATAVKIRT